MYYFLLFVNKRWNGQLQLSPLLNSDCCSLALFFLVQVGLPKTFLSLQNTNFCYTKNLFTKCSIPLSLFRLLAPDIQEPYVGEFVELAIAPSNLASRPNIPRDQLQKLFRHLNQLAQRNRRGEGSGPTGARFNMQPIGGCVHVLHGVQMRSLDRYGSKCQGYFLYRSAGVGKLFIWLSWVRASIKCSPLVTDRGVLLTVASAFINCKYKCTP